MFVQKIGDLPIAVNVCEQVLREVEKQPGWSMAHVIMNPLAQSLLHYHEKMTEIYVITKGFGELGIGRLGESLEIHQVAAGSVFRIPKRTTHMLKNKSGGHLEHLVFALPPFESSDVRIIEGEPQTGGAYSLSLPKAEDCFDGAKILPYSFPQLDLSIAFGWAINDPARHKKPHYHIKAEEFVYVVEGEGFVEIDQVHFPIQSGEWIRIKPGTEHALRNESPEDLVVVCVCSPAFQMEDVRYR
jgi:mannose-6-phosphate isomerase-like protein (cupin superfamily)